MAIENRRCLSRAPLVYTLAVRRILDWVMGMAEALGGPGLLLIAFLDSSFLSFPEVTDVLMISLVAKYPERMLWYAALPTIGSVAGCYVLYALARRGGEAFMRKRLHERHVERAFTIFRKYGLLAVAVPSILPPPVPFKIFVLAAGAAGMTRMEFLIAISIGRGLRFFGEALLAAWYGETALAHAERFVRSHPVVVIGLLITLVLLGLTWIWWSRRRARFDWTDGSSV
jgi:membrane protein YqaA with SNARE-associated domain